MTVTPLSPGAGAPSACRAEGTGSIRTPSSFLQTTFWAEFKAAHGWKPHFFLIGPDGLRLSVLVRRLSRFASIAYVPMGPDLDCADPAGQGRLLGELAASLAPYLPGNTFCVRFDPPWGTSVPNSHASEDTAQTEPSATSVDGSGPLQESFPEIPLAPAKRAPAHVQPPDTVILDLAKTEETLLAEMKSKWRYNIRLGEKKGLTVRYLEGEEGATAGVDAFYALYLETASRDGIAVHSRDYYADLVRRAGSEPGVSVRVYLAEHEGKPLASIITLFAGQGAVYLYGASSNEKRNLMPAYSLQWQAIRDAKGAGCARYDFYGIPPTDDPSHPMHGLYRFKTGFGGTIVHRVGSLDVPLRSGVYRLYRLAEAGRAFWFKKAVKLLRKETRRKS